MGYIYLTVNGKLIEIGGGYACYDPDAFEWYTMTEDDLTWTYNAYNRAAFVNGINTSEPNIIVPATLGGYPLYWNMSSLPSTVRRIKFADMEQMKGSFIVAGTASSPNTTLKEIHNVPPLTGACQISYCSILDYIDLSAMTSATDIVISYNELLPEIPELPSNFSGANNFRNKLWHNASAANNQYRIPVSVTSFENALSWNNISRFTMDSTWESPENVANALGNNPLTDVYYASNTATQEEAWTNGGKSIGGGTWFDAIATTRTGNILRRSAYTAAPVTIHCNYGSAIYSRLRYAQASQNYMMRNLRLHLLDNHPLKQISFWGDSLTRRNESTSIQSDMVEQFHDWMADDVFCWNMGHGGAGSGTNFPNDYNSQQARWNDDVHVIWIGTNDTILTEAQTIANIQTMINTIGATGKCIVLQPFGWGYASENEVLYNQAFPGITINTHKYIIEHGFDVLGRNPTTTEQEQLNNDTIPDVFVDTSDRTHITRSGGLVIASAIKEKLLSLDYITSGWLAN